VGQIWNDVVDQRLRELRKEFTQEKTAEKLSKEFGYRFTRNSVKNREAQFAGKDENKEILPKYKETHEILADGSHKSDKLLVMSAEDEKDVNYLLRAHGFDVDEWELVSARNNIWNTYSKQDGVMTLYASKITVKPKSKDNSFVKLIEVITSQKPFKVKLNQKQLIEHYLLEIAPTDTHFGISTYEDYIPNQERIIRRIRLRHWEQIVIPIGNDLFDNDDFRGRTSSGREIQKVDMDLAWNDAQKFYYSIIEEAMKHSNKVKVIYVKGNHDESMSWAFVKNIVTKFPDIDYDDRFKEHKAHVFHDVFLGFTHGDKNRKNLANVFNAKYRMQIAKAKVREIHIGHLHGEDSKDDYGIMVRTLPTQNKEDEWHDENGYVGKNKRFMAFEYSKDNLEGTYYV
jgi:hypothetical protein